MPDFGILKSLELMTAKTEAEIEKVEAKYRRRWKFKIVIMIIASLVWGLVLFRYNDKPTKLPDMNPGIKKQQHR